MRLSELDAEFISKAQPMGCHGGWGYFTGKSVDGAQGVLFICPKCQKHSVLVLFANPRNAAVVPVEAFPRNEKRWQFSGDAIDELTLTPSIDLSQISPDNPASPSRCYWHGFITKGDAK
jgi:hypothetical protein